MRIAGVVTESVVDGPGVRFVVFGQGCTHGCDECQNPDTWDPLGGMEITPRELIKQIRKAPAYIKGVTLSGGDPFMQAKEMAEVARRAHNIGLDVVTYTGYLYEDLINQAQIDQEYAELLGQTDILIDGPYIKELRDIGLRFRGSLNQRIIDMKESRLQNKLILLQDEHRNEAKICTNSSGL